MSRRATDWAWRQDIKATMKLVLLALADRADEYHRAYPSAERLERDTRLNIKTIRSNLKSMQDLKIIRDTGKRKGSTKQITVWELLGVEDDVKHEIPRTSRATTSEGKVPENGHLSKTPKNGQLPDSKVPKIGSERYPKTDFKGTQNWVTEPVNEPVKDPLKDLVSCNDELLEAGKPKAEFEFPTNKLGEFYPITLDNIFEFRELYPAVDVTQELRNMLGWLRANPTRRKTYGGVARFINTWLAKKQNAGQFNYAPQPQSQVCDQAKIQNEINLAKSKIAGLEQDIMQRQKWNNSAAEMAIRSFKAEIESLKSFVKKQQALLDQQGVNS